MSVTLGKLEQMKPKLIWESEPAHFTPWLASNLGLLGESLGLDLELIRAESSVGPFACDIEAKDTLTGRKVVIENQLQQTDHTHLGQLVTYAAGLKASVVVWISPLIRDEHRAAIDFLNQNTIEGIDFFAVELEVVKIGDSLPAVVFRLAASPNTWTKTLSTMAQPSVASSRMLAYQQFYQTVIDELRTVHNFTNARAGQPQSWYSFSSGTRGFLYSTSFTSKAQLRAELYIDVGDERNKPIFDYFYSMKGRLEKTMGEPLSWERLDNRRASRISALRPNSSIDEVDTQGLVMQKWVVERLLKVKSVFGPYLKSALQVVSNAEKTTPLGDEFSESVPVSDTGDS